MRGGAPVRRDVAARSSRGGPGKADRSDPRRPRKEDQGRPPSTGSTSTGLAIVDAPHSVASAEAAVALAREGKVEALMKGSLHTDELMGAVVKRETGLRTKRRISHCFVMDVPALQQALIITDAAVNIAPTLQDKVDIIQNAIDLAHVFGRQDAEGRDPLGDRDGQPERAIHDRGRRAVQDGRPRSDHGRRPRRAAGARQRDQPGRGEDQEDRVAGRGTSRHPRRPRSRGRQHARQEPDVPGERRGGRESSSARGFRSSSRAGPIRSRRVARRAPSRCSIAHARRQVLGKAVR